MANHNARIAPEHRASGWKKGQSGNPAGVPKATVEIKKLAQERGPEAFKKICDLMKSKDQKVAFAACQEVLNRAYGKPSQAVDVTHHKSPLDDLDAATLRTLVLALAERPAGAEGGSGEAVIN